LRRIGYDNEGKARSRKITDENETFTLLAEMEALDDLGPENQRVHEATSPKRPLKGENSSEFGRPGPGG
jgi:hypothetical protein